MQAYEREKRRTVRSLGDHYRPVNFTLEAGRWGEGKKKGGTGRRGGQSEEQGRKEGRGTPEGKSGKIGGEEGERWDGGEERTREGGREGGSTTGGEGGAREGRKKQDGGKAEGEEKGG